MQSKLDADLKQVTEETFASLAFLLPLDEEERGLLADDSPAAAPKVCVRVAFSGPLAGCLVLSVSRAVLQPLAANMLGLIGDCSASAEQQQDALKELSNVVCGNLLPRVATPKDVFRVHSPEIVAEPCNLDVLDGRPAESQVTLWLEFGPVDASLFVHQGVAAGAV